MMTMMINDEDDKDSKVMIDPMVHILECNVSRGGDHDDDFDNNGNDDVTDKIAVVKMMISDTLEYPMVHLLECNVSRRGDHHDNDDYDNIDNDDMADIDNSGKDDDI